MPKQKEPNWLKNICYQTEVKNILLLSIPFIILFLYFYLMVILAGNILDFFTFGMFFIFCTLLFMLQIVNKLKKLNKKYSDA